MHPAFDVNAFNTRFKAWCKKWPGGHESEDEEDPDEEVSDEEDSDEEVSDEEDSDALTPLEDD